LPRIFIGNFDFEHELAARSVTPTGARAVVQQVSSELARAWVAVAEEDDIVLASGPIDRAEFADLAAAGAAVPRFVRNLDAVREIANLELVPWGWTPAMADLAAERGWSSHRPPLEIVRQVNSRAFRWELEPAFGVGLPESAIANSVDGLREIIATAGGSIEGWILKSNYGMAGRESVRGRGPSLPEPLCNWAQKRIAQVGCVVFEPLVPRLAEAGIQIEIPAVGRSTLMGVTPLLVDQGGTYRGSRFGSPTVDVEPWEPAIDVALRVADRLQQLGYFGPLGIDAMLYRGTDGQPRLRPLQDLNARWTMGRLALGFGRILPAGWCASWLHLPRRTVSAATMTRLAGLPVVRERRALIIPTSGSHESAAVSLLIFADSPEVRTSIEAALWEPSLTRSGCDFRPRHHNPNA
jgi:hypothetical protein